MFVPPYVKKQLNDAGCGAVIAILEAVGTGGGGLDVNLEDHSSACDGSNVTFVLAGVPSPANSAIGYVNQGGAGAFLPLVYGVDFTLSGATVTMATAPIASSKLYFSYALGS